VTEVVPREHAVTLVRPGPLSLAWLSSEIHRLQDDDPLQAITVVAASPYMRTVLRQSLAETGCASVRFTVQLRPLAERIGRACGSHAFDRPLTGPIEAAAIRVAAYESAGPTLQPLTGNRALQESLGSLFRELGHLPEDDPGLTLVTSGSGIGAAAGRTYRAFTSLTQEFADVPRQLRIAARLIRESATSPAWAQELGALVLYLPERTDAAEQDFLRAISQHVPIGVALAWLDDAEADHPTHQSAGDLASMLGVEISTRDGDRLWPGVQVLSAPDPEEEMRTVMRRVLAEMEAGVPLWRMAILYTSEDPYAALVRETLESANVPWHAALGRPALSSLAARSLLGLLDLRERNFAREAVLDWLAARPTLEEAEEDPLPAVPVSAWDRLSRRAQVLQGADQWVSRFGRLIATLELEEQARQDWHAEALVHESEDHVTRPAHDLAYARAIVESIQRLARETRPPGEPAAWDAYVDWAEGLRRTFISNDPHWPVNEVAAAEALDAALDSLRQASAVEPRTTLQSFRDSLAAALDARRIEEGRAGVGILVAPLGASLGASFDRTFIVGLSEGALPSRPGADPFTSGLPFADPLGRLERQRCDERRAFLAGLASVGDQGRIWLSFSRADGGNRASFPSRWLLEQVARVEGATAVYASDLPRLFGPERPWLERVASAYDGLQRAHACINLADLRLREVVAANVRHQNISQTAVAARPDLILGRALRAARARQTREFTEFDGNLQICAADSQRISRPFDIESHGSSATALERWSNCPYRYFLANVVRVEATDKPEEEWTITPLDRGSLVHQVLEEFFRERRDQGRSTPGEPYSATDHVRMEEIATALIADLEAQGRTGHAVAWENARATLIRDLHLELDREEVWRLEDRLAPVLFERTFGDSRDPNSWPAVELELAHGSVIRFRGAIDRIDQAADRVLVVDYKSGGTWGYDGLDVDPVLAGRHLQLALYGRAARVNLAEDSVEVRAEFRFVSSRGRFERRQVVVDHQTDARLAEVVGHAVSGIRDGAFLPMPGEFDRGAFSNCRFCEFERICSTSRDEAWQRKSPGASFVPLETLG
jgi:ATP-dependent helicase/nuclease subunit B